MKDFFKLLILSVLTCILFSCKENKQSQAKTYIKGLDISKHNGDIRFYEIDKRLYPFVYIKATEGSKHTDSNYKINNQLAKKSGFIVGAYHFFSFNSTGREQAYFFLSQAEIQKGDLIPALDIEHSKQNTNSNDSVYIAHIKEEIKIFNDIIDSELGQVPIIYCNEYSYKKYIEGNLNNNYLWLVNLNEEPNTHFNWILWQFTHSEKIKGISEKVDVNKFRYTQENFHKLLLK